MRKLLIITLSILTFISCEEEPVYEDFQSPSLIRQIGETEGNMRVITYYNTGKVFEDLNRFSYRKYTYNDLGQLSKIEIAQSLNPLSCAIIPGATFDEGDDPRKAPFGMKLEFEHDENGNVLKKSQYIINDGHAQLMHYNTFEIYENNIVRVDLYDINNTLIHYSIFTYDSKGNLTSDKQYYHYNNSSEDEIQSLATYDYDNKKNPFTVFRDEYQPGIYTSPNNVLRVTRYYYFQGEVNDTMSYENSYEYNDLGYPVMVNNIVYTYGEDE